MAVGQEGSLRDAVEPEFLDKDGTVQSCRALIGRSVTSRRWKIIGAIEDVILDLDLAQLALITVMPTESVAEANASLHRPRAIVVPGELLLREQARVPVAATQKPAIAFTTAPLVSPDASDLVYSRSWAAGVYRHYREKPYWKDSSRDPLPTNPLVPISILGSPKVAGLGEEGRSARLIDFAFDTQTGKLLYGVVQWTRDREDGNADDAPERIAIPLSVLRASDDEQHWHVASDQRSTEWTRISGNDWPAGGEIVGNQSGDAETNAATTQDPQPATSELGGESEQDEL
jgi:sporulation protein YlmC with PRC-barrel domain